jgi:hypothetical protein
MIYKGLRLQLVSAFPFIIPSKYRRTLHKNILIIVSEAQFLLEKTKYSRKRSE